ncbi:MAG: NAD(P)/FAD-dependent oxidoreductase [Thermoanaerobaculia bacterium]
MSEYDIAIVGAGAAGLMAAIFAGRGGASVIALDGAKRIGAKILIAGGGRCNVTHDVVNPDDFNGNRNIIAKVLRSFDVHQTIEFFRQLGVELKREENGKLFPVTDRAQTVLDALLQAASNAGAAVLSDHRVSSIRRDTTFEVMTSRGAIIAKRVILATGGRSVPKTGSDGAGYELARALGHTVAETFPGLVPLLLPKNHWLTTLSGVSVDAELALRSERGGVLHRERGSMLFTHFGLSGPVVLDMSRHWVAARKQGTVMLTANVLPSHTFESLERSFMETAAANPRATIVSALRGEVPERLANAIAPDATPLARLSREERRQLVRSLTELPLPVIADRGFDYAEVTAGGVPLTEIDAATMASRRCEGLYLCGEILDVDGKIGGYNFQWAWASGRLAGMHSAR